MFDLQNLDLIPLEDKQKHKKIIDYCKKHNVKKYIETGAYRGKTVEAIFMAKKLGNIKVVDIFAIELSEQHANKLLKTYNSRYIDVHIHKGDTVKELPKVLQKITEPALFWLDAHYSGGDTAKGNTDCPALKELAIIAKHKIKDHIILIDDARAFHFKHSPDWPSLKRIYNAIKKINKNYDIFIENDIIIAQLEN